MKPRTIQRLATATCLALGALHHACAANAPALLGQFALGASPTSLSVTPDGSRVLVQVQGPSGTPAELQVIDVGDPGRPIVRGRLAIQRTGEAALSADGRSALLVQAVVPGRLRTPGTYQVTSLDLRDPGNLRVAWERTVRGTVMALAQDASAWAYARGVTSAGERDEVTVVRADGQQAVFRLDDLSAASVIRIAPGARFVAVDAYGWTVEDLSTNPGTAFTRQRSAFQPDGCMLANLPGGHLVVEDLRAPRFGVYAPQGHLPRVAKIAYAGTPEASCQFALIGRAGNVLLLRHANGTLYPLDMSDVLHPQMREPLVLPAGSFPAGLDAKGRLYAFRIAGSGSRLEIYDRTRTAPPKVDWAALERVHAEALRIYAGENHSGFQRAWNAVRAFEQAGTLAALDAPVTGITNHAAAAIFNDYAFLLQRIGPPGHPDVRALLRRAIQLDPDRRVAYVNLADALQQSLPVEAGSREDWLVEARANYGQYLARGGRPVKDLQVLLEGRRRPSGDICKQIVDFANAGRLGELIRSTAVDVAAGDRHLDLSFTTEGTAHVPTVYAWDAADDSPVEDLPVPDAEQLWGGDALGLVVVGDVAHILHYRDDKHPVKSIALSGGQACEFETSTVQRAGADALEPELCARLDAASGPASLEFDGPARMTNEDVAQAYRETGLNGSRRMDFADDGQAATVGEFGMSSGAGPGCEQTFFRVLDDDAAHFQPGPQDDRLTALQGDLECGNQARFFIDHGKFYFESKPAQWPPVDQRNSYHRVARIRGGGVEDVCHFSFRTTVRLRDARAADGPQRTASP